jgi:hypothetical protein
LKPHVLELNRIIARARCPQRATGSQLCGDAHLKQRIEAFITYFNQTMAKPFRWTMKGRPLTV